FLAIVPGLFVTGMIHAKDHRNRTHHTKLAPAYIQFGIGIVLEATHAVRPVTHSRQTNIQTRFYHRFKILPLAGPIARKNEGIALYACISLACMIEATYAIIL